MTCVLTSAWQPFTDSPWSPMNPDINATTNSLERQSSHGYASSESDAKRPGGSSGKKRASRAGTRSVTTLSAAQLERKRANDREAQRAIRQRTKDHIESLEKTVSDLRSQNESNEQVVSATRQRNRELEDEIAFLRSKLDYSSDVPQADLNRQSGHTMLSVQSTSPVAQTSASSSSIQRPSSTSTPRSLSVTTASTDSRHGSFQQQGGFLSTPSSAATIADHGALAGTIPLSTWRSHDGTVPPQPHAQEPPHTQHAPTYHAAHSQERPDWAGHTQQYHFSTAAEHQRLQQYDTQQPPHPQPSNVPQHYAQTPAQAYAPAPAPSAIPQQQPYQPPQLPQGDFQGIAVSSPGYQIPHQQHSYHQHAQPGPSYHQPPQPQVYQQVPALQNIPGALGQMQPPPLPVPATQYQAQSTEQQYAPQVMHPPMQYRDDVGRSYSLSHYPSG